MRAKCNVAGVPRDQASGVDTDANIIGCERKCELVLAILVRRIDLPLERLAFGDTTRADRLDLRLIVVANG